MRNGISVKQFLLLVFLAALLAMGGMYFLQPTWSPATTRYTYTARVLAGGAAGTGSMDDIPSAALATGDLCLVITSSNKFYMYYYDSTSATAENSPNVIAPDDIGGGNGRWLYAGLIQGKTVVGSDISTNTTLTNEQAHNGFYVVTAACTVTLPAAATAGFGSTVCIYVRDAAEQVIIDSNGADKINLHGTALTAGYSIDSPLNAGDFIALIAHTDVDGSGGDGWITVGYGEAVWTDGGAS